MIPTELSIPLPAPWKQQSFAIRRLGPVNFLVGPNGSGKSRFVEALLPHLGGSARLLGTDRLSGMEQLGPLRSLIGDPFAKGFAKDNFQQFKQASQRGSGLDTIVLLEERSDLLIQVEATLGHLFDREIVLEWDSGRLVPKVRRRRGVSYRLDREECHGIKELLVLLTHLYYDGHSHLIVDEPELNLHPQYQAFFMQEVRKFAGDPSTSHSKKIVLLVTHSPFILDFRSEDDLRSIISFDLDHSIPVQVSELSLPTDATPFSLARRANTQHKQFFFADNPIFVEGVLDARLVEAILEARGRTVAGSGSCVIDAGGCEEVNHYFELCQHLGKKAHFLYDLDSLFSGHLRACIRDDVSVVSFLARTGLGGDFARYCGDLDKKLTKLIDWLLAHPVCGSLEGLVAFLESLGKRRGWKKQEYAKARVATLTAISLRHDEIVSVASETEVLDIQGHLRQIVNTLRTKNIHLLPGGTIERYLPAYSGDCYLIADSEKRRAVSREIDYLATPRTEAELSARYEDLYRAVNALPSKADVDMEPTIRRYLGRYIYELQFATARHVDWRHEDVAAHLHVVQPGMADVFSLVEFSRIAGKEFSAVIEVTEMLGQGRRRVRVSHRTNAGMGGFELEDLEAPVVDPRGTQVPETPEAVAR